MDLYGTAADDFIIVKSGTDHVFALGGDDVIRSSAVKDFKVDGGGGFDIFEFQLFEGQTLSSRDVNDEKTVVKIFDDGIQVQKIVIVDVEQIDWFMVG